MRIAPKPENLDLAEQAMMDISDPGSLRCGQHWTVDRVSKKFAASVDAINAVQAWLTYEDFSSNVISLSTDRPWIKVRTTSLSQVASLLETEYHFLRTIKLASHMSRTMITVFPIPCTHTLISSPQQYNLCLRRENVHNMLSTAKLIYLVV